MKLTNVLFRFAKRLPKGDIYRGKYRLVKPVTPLSIARKTAEFRIEEENMFYLRHPYFTVEQEWGHAKQFNHKEKFFQKIKEGRTKNWKEHRLLGDRFGFLKVADKWE